MNKRTAAKGAAFAAMAFFSIGSSNAQTIQVEQGYVSGKTADAVEAFLGLPYAATTAGDNRWRAPRPAPAWTGVRQATEFGPACQQQLSGEFGPFTIEYLTHGDVSEDCLSLNIWRPENTPATAQLPVMVWIHGGGFSSGTTSVPIYDGAPLARRGIIVVSVNYRLGVFGFLAHPELTREGGGSGNFGLLDLVAALSWVQTNIASFGGDPAQITLAGQSAGSMAIHDLMASPSAKGLFARVISESGPGIGYPPQPIAAAEEKGKKLLAAAGVDSVVDLRKLPPEDLQKAAASLGSGLLNFAPVIDGALLPSNPYVGGADAFNDTPILAGMNADEAFSLPKTDIAGLNEEIDTYFGQMSEQARNLYAVTNPAEARDASRRLRRERGIASTYRWAASHANASKQPIYLYLFEHVEPGSEEWGAFHTSEVPYALQTLDKASNRSFGAVDLAVSEMMASYWTNFVKTGDPNGKDASNWPPFRQDQPKMRVLDEHPRTEKMLNRDIRNFYERVSEGGNRLTLF